MRKLYFLFFMAFLPLVVSAQAVEIDGIYYNLNSSGDTKTAEVTQNSNKYSGDIVIPESVTYEEVTYSVTSIGQYAFYRCSGLTSLTIGNSVTSIGDYAFQNCSGLTSVTIPNSVTSIGDATFSGCRSLTSVTIPNSVTSIGDFAFYGCSGLTSVTIPNSVTSIDNSAFYGCIGLTSVTIPNSVGSIGNFVFADCSGLTSLTIGNSVTSIGDYAFQNCSGLTSVTIPNGVTFIGNSAFRGCSGLTSVTIPNSVTSIGDYAFGGCSGLTSVTIPNNVTSIPLCIFADCTGLTSVTIPNSVTSIGDNAFSGCSGLTSVTIPDRVTSIDHGAFSGCSGLTSVTIPNGVTFIGNSAFRGCSGLTSVTIPNSVTSIGSYAFNGCSGFTSFIIPNSVTSIGDAAFSGCSDLTSVIVQCVPTSIDGSPFYECLNLKEVTFDCETITNLFSGVESIEKVTMTEIVTSIGDQAFSGCSGLTSFTIPNSVTSIGYHAFSGCNGLTSVNVQSVPTSIGNSSFDECSNLKDVTFDCETVTNLFFFIKSIEKVTMTDKVTSIVEQAFSGCSGLTSVTIPNSVTSIGNSAFSGCSGLTSMIVQCCPTSIGSGIFWSCSSFKEVTFDCETVTKLFSGVESIEKVTMTDKVTSIDENAFSGCNSLTAVNISNIEAWCKIAFTDSYGFSTNPLSHAHHLFLNGEEITEMTIPNSVTSIGDYAFDGCSGLTSLTIPNSVTSIGDRAFNNCGGLTSVIVQCSPTTTGSLPFNDCSSIKEVTFDCETVTSLFSGKESIEKVTMTEKVTSISEKAFYGCKGLNSVTIPNSVTTIGNSAFYDCGLTSVTFGNSVTSIGNSAFSNCSGLTSVTIPNSVTSIGDRAFSDCSDLTSVNVQCVPTSIGGWSPFYNCSNLKEVTFDCETVTKLFSGMKSIEKATMTEKVTSIVENAFWGCSGLTSVIVQCVPTSIGYYPFYECSNLKDVTFDCEMVTKLFSGIKSIEKATITEKVTSIGPSAFYGCSGLTFVTIPNSVTSIGEDAFYGCTGLTSFTIPNSVTSIGNSAFRDCSGLTSVTIPNSVGSIGNFVFADCSGLTSLTIGNSVTSIGDYAFQNCSGLASLTIPNSVISIGAGAFYNTAWYNNQPDGLVYAGKVAYLYKGKMPENTAITLESGTLGITRNAFSGCSGLTSVTIPTSVISIGLSPFGNCSKLTSIVVEDGNTVYDSRDNCNAIIETSTNTLIAGCHNTKIPNSVAHIGNSAFWNCNGLKTLAIPEGVKSIGSSAFGYCYYLQTLELPSSLEVISPYAFGSCTRLTNIISHIQEPFSIQNNVFDISTWNNGVETITPSPATLYVPQSSIDAYKATEGWSSFKNVLPLEDILANIEFADAKVKEICVANWDTNGDGELSKLEASMVSDLGNVFRYKYELRSFHELKYFTGLISISGFAFSGINDFSVTIPENVKDIDFFDWHPRIVEVVENNPYLKFVDGVLYNNDLTILYYCTEDGDKQEFEIPNSVKRISSGAFNGRKMTSVTIPQSVTDIWAEAFWGCSSLTTIFIPNSVTYIGTGVFGGCKNLTSIIVEKDNPVYDSRDNCNAIIKTSDNTLIQGCSTTVIPQDVTTIGDYAFWGINSLKHIEIPPSVLSIGSWAFTGTGLTSVIIPKTVTSISDSFMASKLKSVIVEHKVPLNINKSAFNALDNSPVLYVPAGSKAAYESADVWKDFAEIIEYDGLESVTIGKSGKASYCGDKSLDFSFSDEIKAYIATGFDKDEGTIWLTRVKDVPAGVPILIKGEADKTYDVPVTDSQNSYYTNMFVGNTSGEKIQIQETDGDRVNYYLSSDGTFKSVNKSANIGNNKCYLQLPGTFKPAVAGETQKVTIKDIGKASYAAPVDLDFTNVEGLKAFTATGYDKSSKTIWLTRVMKVQKGEGVLLKGDAKDYEIPSAAVQSSYMNMFVGNTSGASVQVQEKSEDGTQTNYYLKGDGSFVSVNGYVNIGNNKCYLELPTSMVSTAASTRAEASYLLDEPEVIKLPILYRSLDSEGNGTTAIKEVKSGEVKGEKWFTLQGQRVENHGKGIYIKNGKKIIVK